MTATDTSELADERICRLRRKITYLDELHAVDILTDDEFDRARYEAEIEIAQLETQPPASTPRKRKTAILAIVGLTTVVGIGIATIS